MINVSLYNTAIFQLDVEWEGSSLSSNSPRYPGWTAGKVANKYFISRWEGSGFYMFVICPAFCLSWLLPTLVATSGCSKSKVDLGLYHESSAGATPVVEWGVILYWKGSSQSESQYQSKCSSSWIPWRSALHILPSRWMHDGKVRQWCVECCCVWQILGTRYWWRMCHYLKPVSQGVHVWWR